MVSACSWPRVAAVGASVVAAAVAAAVGSALQKENMIGVRGKMEGRREERGKN